MPPKRAISYLTALSAPALVNICLDCRQKSMYVFAMIPNALKVGFIRKSDKHSLPAQRAAMERAEIVRVYDDWELCLRQRRRGSGDVVAVHKASALADPVDRRKLGGLRASFRRNLDRLEKTGSTLLELSTGLSTAIPSERDQITRAAEDELGRVRRFSHTGRPRRVWSPEQLAIMRIHWRSRDHETNRDAAKAVQADGVPASASMIFKALGPSGRSIGPKPRK